MYQEKAQLFITRKEERKEMAGLGEGREEGRKRKASEKERENRKERENYYFLFVLRFSTVRTDKPYATFNSTLFLNRWVCIDEINALQSIL